MRTLVVTAWTLDRSRMVAQMALLVVAGLIGGAGLALLIPIVNAVAGPSDAITLPVVGAVGTGSLPLWVLLAAFVALVAGQALIQRAATVNSAQLQQRVVDRLRHDAFAAILIAKWSFVVGLRRTDIIQVVTMGASRSGMALDQMVNGSVKLVLVLATAVVALVVDPLVAALAILGIGVMAAAQASGIAPAHRLGRLLGERHRELQAVVTDSLDSLRLVRAHDASELWVDRLAAAFSGTREVQLANTERMTTISALTSVGTAAAAALLVGVSVWAGLEPAGIVVMVVLIGRLSSQATAVVRIATQLANSLPAVGDITRLTADARGAVEAPGSADRSGDPHLDPHLDPGAPLVEFRNVSFTYPSSGGGVRNLDLVVPRGAITALSGVSGAGKSTTADLALGLLEPDSGEVRVGGQSLSPGDLAWWRGHVAYVPQESLLLPGTLRDNLAWSTPHAVTDAECLEALHRSVASFVDHLPDGLDTELGDRGVRLSGGERQRVAIARALLRRPELLVLDEATSALDDDTEAAVLDTIANLVPAVTVLVIAHRRTTLDIADHVVRIVGPT
jgi:ATP-binding cassette subfamily C protein